MEKYTYSITITHYNAPKLLARMLKSIPEREDIQVIVVDDASTKENKFELAKLEHKNLHIKYLQENKGGGYARNAGLELVQAKWLIGVDCDDYFSANAFDVLDKYKDEEIDCLMYSVQLVDQDNIVINKFIESTKSTLDYLASPSEKNLMALKYRNTVTWNKMVSTRFIKENNVQWEDCRVNIDVLFSFLVTTRMSKFKIIPDYLYNLVTSDNSITRKKRTIEREFQFYLAAQKRNGFFLSIGLKKYPYYRKDYMYALYMLKKRGLKGMIIFVRYVYQHKEEVAEAKNCYASIIKKTT